MDVRILMSVQQRLYLIFMSANCPSCCRASCCCCCCFYGCERTSSVHLPYQSGPYMLHARQASLCLLLLLLPPGNVHHGISVYCIPLSPSKEGKERAEQTHAHFLLLCSLFIPMRFCFVRRDPLQRSYSAGGIA